MRMISHRIYYHSLSGKYKLALKQYLPQELIELISLQQARLQEHSIIQQLRKKKKQTGKQIDIRNMFGRKGKTEKEEEEKDDLKNYKQKFTVIFCTITKAVEKGIVPPFLPLNEQQSKSSSEYLHWVIFY